MKDLLKEQRHLPFNSNTHTLVYFRQGHNLPCEETRNKNIAFSYLKKGSPFCHRISLFWFTPYRADTSYYQRLIQKDAVSPQQLQVCTPPRPWLRHSQGVGSSEFLLFPSRNVKHAHPGHNKWPQLVLRVGGGQSSESRSWLNVGSDSQFPGEGWEGVCICFPSIPTRSWDPWEQDAQFQGLICSLSLKKIA